MSDVSSVHKPVLESDSDYRKLSLEAAFFHRKIFGWSGSEEILRAYVAANEVLLKNDDCSTLVNIDFIVKREIDIEAIEIALRRKYPQNLLTRKLLILCYLAESRSEYFTTFVNEQHQPLRAFLKLSFVSVRSVYKLLKGRWLLWKYDVV